MSEAPTDSPGGQVASEPSGPSIEPSHQFVSPQKLEARDSVTLKPFNDSLRALKEGLSANDEKDVDDWYKSRLWRPFFNEFVQEWLQPHIDTCTASGTSVEKGPTFTKILEHLDHEEAHGKRKFSRAHVDKSNWLEIDYYAYFLYQVTNENTQDINGMLRAKQLTPDQRYWAMYQAMVYKKKPFAASKVQRSIKNKSKRVLPTPTSDDQSITVSDVTLPTRLVTIRDMSKRTASLGRPAKSRLSLSQALARTKRLSGAQSGVFSPNKRSRLSVDFSNLPVDDNAKSTQKADNSEDENNAHPGTPKPRHDGETPDEQIARELAAEQSASNPTSPMQKVPGPEQTNESDEEDREEPTFLNTNQAIMREVLPDSTWDMKLRFWQLAGIFTVLGKYESEMHYESVLLAAGGRDILLMDAATEAWRREVEGMIDKPDGTLRAPEVTRQDLVQSREDDQRHRTLETERPDSAESREYLNCAGERPGLPGMPRSIYLRFWQIPAIHAIMCFQEDFTGCILADKMGLGKTMIFVGHILQNIYEREKAIANGAKVAAKPKLVLVPANLVGQTMNKIRSYTTNLRVIRYHDDERRRFTGNTAGPLTRESVYFDTSDEANASTVIVSSHATFAGRHGPGAQRKWREEEHGLTRHTTDILINHLDENCPAILIDKFDIIWLDEADAAKRHDSRLNVCLQWTNAEFLGLSTATPNRNSLRDTEGYLNLIKARKPLTEDEKLELRLADPHAAFNPYQIDKKERAALLRLDVHFAKKHIFDICESDPITAGANMAKLNELITIRRTHASKVDGRVIGESIPPLVRRQVEVRFDEKTQAWYDRIADAPLRYLVTIDKRGELIWNASNFRKLVLFSMWPGFQYVESKVYADSITKWKKADNLLYEWLSLVHKELSPNDPNYFELPIVNDWLTQIRILCQAAPKIRTIVSQMEDVVRNRRKKAFWFLLPSEQLLVWDVLTKLGIDARMFSSDLTQEQRDKLIQEWNEDQESAYVLLLVFSMNSCGLDLHTYCNETVNVDIPMSRAILESADHRFRRVGQSEEYVLSWNYIMPNTIMDRQVQNNLRKALGNVMSELNSSMFSGQQGDLGQAGADVTLDIGRWVIVGHKLTPWDHPTAVTARAAGVPVIELAPLEVIRQILHEEKGQWVDIETPSTMPWTDLFQE